MQSPIIETFTTSESFKYLWLKYVTGFDLSKHCARCLLGQYSRHFGNGQPRTLYNVALDESPANYYYLCGVTEPYRYNDNLHLAFKYKAGGRIEYTDRYTHIVIRDAERIEIQAQRYYARERYGYLKEYCTCRNWRFAYQIVHGVEDGK